MAFLGDGFAAMLESRKKFVDSTNEVQGEAVAGTGDGTGRGLDSSLGSVQTFTKKSPTGYCGLANQGATCYLNSLLQSMYMLPGFRAAVYGWRFDEAQHGDGLAVRHADLDLPAGRWKPRQRLHDEGGTGLGPLGPRRHAVAQHHSKTQGDIGVR